MNSVLIVLTNSVDGQDVEFNDWYDNVHLPEVLALDGFVSASRYKLSESQLPAEEMAPSQHRYAAIYELDTEPAQAFETLLEEVRTGRMVLPPCMDQTTIGTWAFDQITARSAVLQA
jgi:hypothetical protein